MGFAPHSRASRPGGSLVGGASRGSGGEAAARRRGSSPAEPVVSVLLRLRSFMGSFKLGRTRVLCGNATFVEK